MNSIIQEDIHVDSGRDDDVTIFTYERKEKTKWEEIITWQWKMYSGDSFLYFMFHMRATPSGSWGDSSLLL